MTPALHVLYLENDAADAELVKATLTSEGIACEITRVETQSEFVAALEQREFDLILADYTLPSFDGLSALKIARQQKPDAPFIFVSGTLGEEVAIEALKIGATDYVLKTRLSRLVPSVQRALREAEEKTRRKRAEEAVRRSEKELCEVINAVPAIVWSASTDGSVDFVNQRWQNFTGLPPENAFGWNWDAVVHPDDRARFVAAWRAALEAGQSMELEVRVRRADGEYHWLLIRNVPLRDELGNICKWYGSGIDIEESRRAEQARRDIEEQWRAAFESNPTMYFMVDAAGNIAKVNAFGAEQLGYSVSELVGEPVLSVFYEPDRHAVQEHAKNCFEQPGRMMRWEARKIRKDGSMLWVRETANAAVLKERLVLLVVCEDITEQKRAEGAARRSASELRDLIEKIPVMVFSIRPDGSTEFVSRNWKDYAGLSLESTTGEGWQSTVHPDDVETHLDKWRTSMATGQPFENEVRHRRFDGEYRWFLIRAVPLRDEHGNILKWYGILTDIEDRKRAEALLTGEKRILEMVAKGDSLAQILDSLCRLVEEQASGVLASILLVENNLLRHGAAPSLPRVYTEAIDGVAIGPCVGSCGTAAYRREQVLVEDIATDPLWADFRAAALPHSLRACWSTPIFSSQQGIIGTFAMYYREPRRPSPREQEIIEQITHLAGVAIERKRTQEALRRSEAYLAEAQRLSHTGSWARNAATGETTHSSEEHSRLYGFDPEQGIVIPGIHRAGPSGRPS